MRSIPKALALAAILMLTGCQADRLGPTEIRFDVDGSTIRETGPHGSVWSDPREWTLQSSGPIAVSIRVVGRQAAGSLTIGGEVSATLTTPDGTFTAAPGGRLAFDGPATCATETSIFDPSTTVTYCRYQGTFAFTAEDDAGRRREVTDGRFTASIQGRTD